MAYLTFEIALAQTLQSLSRTHGGHCPLLCTGILAVLSDIQQVQQIHNVSAHQALQRILKEEAGTA